MNRSALLTIAVPLCVLAAEPKQIVQYDISARLRVDAIDETEFLRGLHRMANRVAVGLVLAALIVGAAVLSRVQTDTRIAGSPAVAFVCFMLAALGGAWLVVSIAVADRRIRRRR